MKKTIVNMNLSQFVQDVADATLQGWDVDPGKPAEQWGLLYEVGMVLNDERASEYVEKPSRAEILQKARAAKAAKAEERASGGVQ
jgi:hypothetical protein